MLNSQAVVASCKAATCNSRSSIEDHRNDLTTQKARHRKTRDQVSSAVMIFNQVQLAVIQPFVFSFG